MILNLESNIFKHYAYELQYSDRQNVIVGTLIFKLRERGVGLQRRVNRDWNQVYTSLELFWNSLDNAPKFVDPSTWK